MSRKEKDESKLRKGKQFNRRSQKFQKTNFQKQSRKLEQFPHFRKYYKSNHPALIVGEQFDEVKKIEEWKYRKVMHGYKDGRHNNETVIPNPNPNDPEPMNIVRRVRHDDKRNFSTWKYSWKYPKKAIKKSDAPRE